MRLNPSNKKAFYQLVKWLLLLITVAVWTGCNHNQRLASGTEPDKAPASPDPAGTYELVSIDDKAVPCKLEHDGHAMEVKSGSFIIQPDGTCSSKIFLAGREAALERKATYTQDGSRLTMKWEKAGMTAGTLERDTFTMNNEGMVFKYRKPAAPAS